MVSRKTACARFARAAFQADRSVPSTKVTSTPRGANTVLIRTVLRPYRLRLATRRWPGSSSVRRAARVAPMPEEQETPFSAPSNRATAWPKASVVGLPSRE